MSATLWRGPLGAPMHAAVQRYLSSFAEDFAVADTDVDVGEAHALALAAAGVLGRRDLRRVLRGYEQARRWCAGPGARAAAARSAFHDIHPLIEQQVAAAAGGTTGGSIHLGKSRNDQVATDIGVHARRGLLEAARETAALHGALVALARREARTPLPVFTHARPAQAGTAAFWALAHAAALGRDAERLLAARARLNRCPLGAAAAAGTSVPLDRALTARLLGFDGVWEHALDATSARDQALEGLAAMAILMSSLSRLAADLTWLAGPEMGVLEYPDALADTSSAMPQKKNPDPLELLRGRAGAMAGALAGALGVVHGLPSGYSRDLQELKPILWRALDQAGPSAMVARLVMEGVRIHPGRAVEILDRGFAAALDLAEVLSLDHGVPFRRAHFAVGRLVRSLAGSGRTFSRCGAAEASAALGAAVGRPVALSEAAWRAAVDPIAGAARRRTRGGPGDGTRLLREAAGVQRTLDAAIRRATAREDAARRALRAAVARAAR